ncbi:hypothetical protein E1176_17125 [Fulvivirga sp. RKSG066]|uniref:hypothetical protein n=1 Tax=Fulvivirga aurantia TaxID=2529383 RepID=UPI0012BBC898|nr:hypothetical protein [Fulvivirga aurantia]MTI22757.1 hypothetical protein [Fulvivirga aurantia]
MQFKSPEDFHNKLGFIFHAMLAVPLAVFIYLFLEIKNRAFSPALDTGIDDKVIIILLVAISVADLAIGYYLHKRNLKNARTIDDFQKKLKAYFTSSLVFWSFIEGGSILMIVGLYLTTSSVFIVGYMFLLLVLSLNRPTPQKYVGDLQLNGEEREIIIHKKPFDSQVN